MEQEISVKHLATSIIDFTDLGIINLGIYSNSIGNFSIIPFNDYWLASFRVFGYFITTETQSYKFEKSMVLEHPDEHIFVMLDHDFNFKRRMNLSENTYYKPEEFKEKRTYLEDGRLTRWNDDLYFTTATFYTNEERWEKMGLEIQRLEVVNDEVKATHIWNSTEEGIMGRHKNWMSVPDKPFTFITGTSTNGAQSINITNNIITDIVDYDPSNDLYRGNTPLIQFNDGYLTITHKLIFDEWRRKRYINFFVEYDRNLKPRWISKPFKLCEQNIEFITTLIHQGDKLMIGVTEMDDTPYLMTFSINELYQTLW